MPFLRTELFETKYLLIVFILLLSACGEKNPVTELGEVLIDQGFRVGPEEGVVVPLEGAAEERLRPDLYYNSRENTLQVNPERVEEIIEYFEITVLTDNVWAFALKDKEINVVPQLVIPHTPIRPYSEEGPDKLGDFVWKADCRCETVSTSGGCRSYDDKEGPSWKWADGQAREYGLCRSTQSGGCLEVITELGKELQYSAPGCKQKDLEGSTIVKAWICLEL